TSPNTVHRATTPPPSEEQLHSHGPPESPTLLHPLQSEPRKPTFTQSSLMLRRQAVDLRRTATSIQISTWPLTQL
ncbi:unnamed protein product, partial [Rangifer tarandus platyrhynchus]